MKDLLVQPGRGLCGGGAGVANGFVGTQEGGDLRVRGEAGEEVAEDGCVFDLARGWVDWGTRCGRRVYSRLWQNLVLGMAG